MLRTTLAFTLLFLGLSPLAQAQPAGRTTTYALIRCESLDRRDSYCPADTRRGVHLVRDLSGGRCRIGSSWGYDRGGIWVDRGCRAEFEIGRYSGGYGWGWGYQGDDYIVCASRDFRQQHCPANTRGGARLVNQISRTPCQQGVNWDFDARGVWVSQGCAGEFEIGRGGGYDDPTDGGYDPAPPGRGVVLCESKDNRRRFCPADLRGARVTVLRNISRVPCQLDLNWGYDERGVWVDRGCRAEFGIGGGDPGWDGGGDPGRSEVIRCASEDHLRNFCAAPNNGGVRLLRQLSRSPCIEGESWGYDDRRVWVDEGCEAEFELIGRYR